MASAGARQETKRLSSNEHDGGMSPVRALLTSMRPHHWVKNLLILLVMPFSGKAAQPWAWAMASLAFAAFCLFSSAIYLFNDIADRQRDQAHPVKRLRPIASGRLGVSTAAAAGAVLLALGAVLVTIVIALQKGGVLPYELARPMWGYSLAAWAGAYVLMTLAYSFKLKEAPIVDVLIVAAGFVLRAMAGAAALAVVISPWLVICTFMLCLFIALAKRRTEIAELGEGARQTRRVHDFYTLTNLDHMLSVSAGLAIVTYSLYCLAERTVSEVVGSPHLIWTVPLVVYGLFRYYCLVVSDGCPEDPVRVLMHDRILWAVVALWIVLAWLILAFGHHSAFQGVLK